MTDYTVDGKHVKAVQYDGDWPALSEAFPSLVLSVDGDQRLFFEKDGERHYVEKGDYVTLSGPKYGVTSEGDFKPDKATAKSKEPSGPTATSAEDTTEVKPAKGSATTDDRK